MSRRPTSPIVDWSSGASGEAACGGFTRPDFGGKLRSRVSDGFSELLGNSRRLYDNFMRIAVAAPRLLTVRQSQRQPYSQS